MFQPGAPTFKVLHLSDTHFDPYYQEGTNADCKEPLCCRLTNGPALSPQTAAGRWGDYRKCDTPKRTVDHMLQHISSTHPVSYPSVTVIPEFVIQNIKNIIVNFISLQISCAYKHIIFLRDRTGVLYVMGPLHWHQMFHFFISLKSQVQILTQRLGILTELSVIFLGPSRQMYLQLGYNHHIFCTVFHQLSHHTNLCIM